MTGPREFHSASDKNFPLHETTHQPLYELPPGTPAGFWRIETRVPDDYDAGCNLYVAGFVMFTSVSGMEHATYFRRRYCPTKQRFIPEDKDTYY